MPKAKKTAKRTGRKVGRPTVDTPEARRKIEEAAVLDASVDEIAFWAGISRDSYYEILKKDPAFSDRIAALRQSPVLAARQAAVKFSTATYSNAMDYLSRKKKDEFSQRNELTGKDGEAIKYHSINELPDDELHRLAEGGKGRARS